MISQLVPPPSPIHPPIAGQCIYTYIRMPALELPFDPMLFVVGINCHNYTFRLKLIL